MGAAAPAQQDSAKPTPLPGQIPTGEVLAVADRLGQDVAAINVSKWKAPNDVKAQAQSDVASIQRNLRTTLPELLDQAKAAGTAVAPGFAVYRDLAAVYDVLLRVAETATMAGAQDATTLEDDLKRLEATRRSLGTAIFDAASARDAEVVQLRASAAQMASQAAAAQAPAKKAVVTDGPGITVKKKRKPAAAPPVAK